MRKIEIADFARTWTCAAGTALALAGAVPGCGTPGEDSHTADLRGSWLSQPPEGCAIGFSGPTMNPGDAIRKARASALQSLMSRSATSRIHIDSTLLTYDSQHSREYTRQELEGFVRGSRVVKMWAETTADPPSTTRVRHVYALACEPGLSPPGVRKPAYPAWVLNLPPEPARICALGVGGPTWNPRRQKSATLADGQRALAEALESRLRQTIEDNGRRDPRVRSEMETTERALAKAETTEELAAEWRDDEGIGPLGLREVLYGMVCVER